MVLYIEGCASTVGFQKLFGKILKSNKVDIIDEEKEGVLVQQVTY